MKFRTNETTWTYTEKYFRADLTHYTGYGIPDHWTITCKVYHDTYTVRAMQDFDTRKEAVAFANECLNSYQTEGTLSKEQTMVA